MNNPRVSIIIPVYNTGKYLQQAIRSILEQTLRQIEIIVIDDGSTDNSASQIEALADEDKRIRLIRQTNAGQAAARNRGLEVATGEFVYFMDSDDLFEADALALCYEKCTAEQLDFVFFDAISFGGPLSQEKWFDYHRAGCFADKVYTGPEVLEEQLKRNIYRCSVCLNLIRRELLERIPLRFYEGIIHEDELFTAILYLESQRVGRIDREFFHRRLREESTMTSLFSKRNADGYGRMLKELRHHTEHRSSEIRRLGRLISRPILRILLSRSWGFPLQERLQLAAAALRHYPRCISLYALLSLLFKKPIHQLLRR